MIKNKLQLHQAFVLHARPYRESSFIIEFFTQDLGRVAAIAQGAKRAKSPFRGILQPFIPLLIQLSGKRELQVLRHAELGGSYLSLCGKSLLCGLYLNELLIKTLLKQDAYPELFDHYVRTLEQLTSTTCLESVLRKFEWRLLKTLGYGLQLEYCHDKAIDPQQYYFYQFNKGLIQADLQGSHAKQFYPFLGRHLLAIAKQDFSQENYLYDAKKLFRYVIQHIIGEKTLHSRSLFA